MCADGDGDGDESDDGIWPKDPYRDDITFGRKKEEEEEEEEGFLANYELRISIVGGQI